MKADFSVEIERGNVRVVIHNLDVIKNCDPIRLLELGVSAGVQAGGQARTREFVKNMEEFRPAFERQLYNLVEKRAREIARAQEEAPPVIRLELAGIPRLELQAANETIETETMIERDAKGLISQTRKRSKKV